MDITKLVARLSEQSENSVFSFEKGRVIQRTFATLFAEVQTAIADLTAWGVKKGMRVGIRAPNCFQWIAYDLALIELRAVSVAFTDDFAANAADELCDKYNLSLLLVMASEKPRHAADASFIAYLDAENRGVKAIERGEPLADENFDRPCLSFSSGSSGVLKGLAMNRRGIEGNIESFTQAVAPSKDDCVILFLPISNFQQRLIYYSALWYGFNFILADPPRLFRALKDLKPTILIAPPSLYEAFETRFFNLPKWKRLAARTAGNIARRLPIPSARAKLGRLIFKQAYETLGGRMRFMVTGMAPIKRTTLELFACMQLPLFETYGLTECGSVALNVPEAQKIGSVGRLMPGVEVSFGEDGEIIVHRKDLSTHGYFECAEGEAERTFIGNNRVATGDIGRIDKDGFLHIVGRKKEIIITGGGEKIHPEAVESEIDLCPDVEKSVVFGGSASPFLIAIVLPKNPQDSSAKNRIENFVMRITPHKSSMSVGKVVFTDIVFSRENGFLRPNLKLDRKRIAEHFRAEIGDLGA